MKRLKIVFSTIMLFGLPFIYAGVSRQQLTPAQKPIASLTATQFGDPLPGLSPDELSRFNNGKAQFERMHTPKDGLGPIFNQVSCVACHSVPATGGSMANKLDMVVSIGRTNPVTGKYDPLVDLGGQVLSRQSVTTFGLESDCKQPGNDIPPEADFVSFRFGEPLFGLGLIEAIADETILANADPNDKDHDGIRGRPNMVLSQHFHNTRIGRFGWKAQTSTLIDLCGESELVQIGITSPDFPTERLPNGKEPKCKEEGQEPEDDGHGVQALVDFITFLAPPPQKQLDNSATRGQQIFSDIGCAKCHIPVLRTAPNPAAGRSLANRDVLLYSDLLLHEMGSDLNDDIVEGLASGSKWRTQPLWGASAKKFFLHNGRASDLSTAIILHSGEAAGTRDRFLKLKERERRDLISFLNSL